MVEVKRKTEKILLERGIVIFRKSVAVSDIGTLHSPHVSRSSKVCMTSI
jgi:hypothetical protein